MLSKGTLYLSPEFFRFAQNSEPRFKSLIELFMAQMEGFEPPRRLPDLSDFESEPFSLLGTSAFFKIVSLRYMICQLIDGDLL